MCEGGGKLVSLRKFYACCSINVVHLYYDYYYYLGNVVCMKSAVWTLCGTRGSHRVNAVYLHQVALLVKEVDMASTVID